MRLNKFGCLELTAREHKKLTRESGGDSVRFNHALDQMRAEVVGLLLRGLAESRRDRRAITHEDYKVLDAACRAMRKLWKG